MSSIDQIARTGDRRKEHFDAKGPRSVVRSAVYSLLNNPGGLWPLLRFIRICSRSDLRDGAGAYDGWFFSGKNPVFPPESFKAGDVSMFADRDVLRAIIRRDNLFSAIPEIRERMIRLVRASVSDLLLGYGVREKVLAAVARARQEGRKLVVLGNHASHFDAAAYEFVLNAATDGAFGLEADGIVRLLAGAYMFYNPSVRVFTPAHHSLFVFGPSDGEVVCMKNRGYAPIDQKECAAAKKEMLLLEASGKLRGPTGRPVLVEYGVFDDKSPRLWREFGPEDRAAGHAFSDFRKKVQAGYSSLQDEILVVFPYAGRAKKGPFAPLGVKPELPSGIKNQLSNPKALYLPMALAGTPAILDAYESTVWGKYNGFGRGPVSVSVGDPIRGEDMDLDGLHRAMVGVSRANLDAFVGTFGGVVPEGTPA